MYAAIWSYMTVSKGHKDLCARSGKMGGQQTVVTHTVMMTPWQGYAFRITGPLWVEPMSLTKGQEYGTSMFSVLVDWPSCWTIPRFDGDMIRHNAHVGSLRLCYHKYVAHKRLQADVWLSFKKKFVPKTCGSFSARHLFTRSFVKLIWLHWSKCHSCITEYQHICWDEGKCKLHLVVGIKLKHTYLWMTLRSYIS